RPPRPHLHPGARHPAPDAARGGRLRDRPRAPGHQARRMTGTGAVEPPPNTAVFLMALGGPDSLDNVEPYLVDLRGGRPTSAELVEEIRERYRATGGRSPVLEITRELGAKLEARRPVRVFVGLRHWHPFIAEA